MPEHSSAPAWPHGRGLPHHWQPDSNDMETDQLPTSRPFNGRPVGGNQQTATHTLHRPLVYVKEEGNAALHLNIANAVVCHGEEKGQSGGGMSQAHINLELWVLVHLDESDGHPWVRCHKMFLFMMTNRLTVKNLFSYYITH